MNRIIALSELQSGLPKSMAILIIARHVLTRTTILSILKAEFPEFQICETAATGEFRGASDIDVRLILLDIASSLIADPWVEDEIAALGRFFPYAPVAILSARDGEAGAAMRRGVRGFFPPSISIEVAIAGLRLVLAGGVYLPLPIDAGFGEFPFLEAVRASHTANDPSPLAHVDPVEKDVVPHADVDLTPREKHVLEALGLGLPNKLIAARLNLSENTVKMHLRHIMKKCCARNRTEAVILFQRAAVAR